jgi:hypothetical protein
VAAALFERVTGLDRLLPVNSPRRKPSAGSGTHLRGRSARRIGATE